MTKKLLFIGMALLAVSLIAMAADGITGKWVFEQAGRGGGPPRSTTLDLKAEGATLTGTATAPAMGRGGGGGEPQALPISNGKVDGNNISFEIARETPMGTMTSKYEGAVAGSEMKLKITMPGRGGGDPMVNEVVAKKQ